MHVKLCSQRPSRLSDRDDFAALLLLQAMHVYLVS